MSEPLRPNWILRAAAECARVAVYFDADSERGLLRGRGDYLRDVCVEARKAYDRLTAERLSLETQVAALEEEARELRVLLGKALDVIELDLSMARQDWTRACLLGGRYCHPFVTVDPRCSRCGDPASNHEVDDEERRECRLCECTQYEAP